MLLCSVILVCQLFFRFKFSLVFIGYFQFWFLIGDLWYLTQLKYSLGQGTDEILPDKLQKEYFLKSYRWISFSFEISLMFGKFGHLKDGSQSCLAYSNPQESVNLQSIKNRIITWFSSRYAQDSRNVTSWRLGDINFQIFLKHCSLDLIRRFREGIHQPSHVLSFISEKCFRLMIFYNLISISLVDLYNMYVYMYI